jgi:hypothetical protein
MHALKLALPVLLLATGAAAQESYDSWPLLQSEFPSTGGGGIVIRGYDPVIAGQTCRTDFAAVEPNGTTYHNSVEFDAVAVAGGTLCQNGRWRARDGSAAGTTPFRVFIKDGIKRGSP